MIKKNPARKLSRVWPILGGLCLLHLLMGSTCILDALAHKVIAEAAPAIQTQVQQTAAIQTAIVQTATAQPTVTPTNTATPNGSPLPTSTAPTPTPTATPTPTLSPGTPPTITTFSPLTGPAGGNTAIFINGTNFVNVTGVFVNGVLAVFDVVSPTRINALSPPGSGTGPITVHTLTGMATSATNWTYLPAPAINNVYPLTGSTGGGTLVSIFGSLFTGTSQVTFNGVPAASFTVNSDSLITAITAPGTGSGPVKISTPATSTQYPYQPWVYTGTTQVSGFFPSNGPTAGGTAVTIAGTNFTGATAVTIAGTAATSFNVDNDGQITAFTAAGSSSGPILVVAPGGTANSSQLFTYDNSPAIESFQPPSGVPAGGTFVDIFGQNFLGATLVEFNGIAAFGFSVVDDTHIQATTDAGTGSGPVAVTTTSGTGHSLSSWVYQGSSPILDGFSPQSGPTAGGTSVMLFGSSFSGTTDVVFAGVSAASFLVLSDGLIQANTAPGTGTGLVKVVTPSGWSYIGLEWSYSDAPSFAFPAISPTIGPGAGGTAVNITGARFTGATSVLFNNYAASSFNVINDNLITAITGPGTGSGPVTVSNATGTSRTSDLWIYASVPVITGAVPFAGSTSGGTSVKIMGSNLSGATGVTIAGRSVVSFTVDSDTQITALTAGSPATAGVIVVTTPGGTATSPFLWTYGP